MTSMLLISMLMGCVVHLQTSDACISSVREAAADVLNSAGSRSWTRMVLVNEVFALKNAKPYFDTIVSEWSAMKRYSRSGATITATDERYALAILATEKKVIIRDLPKNSTLYDPLLSFRMLRDSLSNVNCVVAATEIKVKVRDAWVGKSRIDALVVDVQKLSSGWRLTSITTDYSDGRPFARTITKAPSFEINIQPPFESVIDLVLDRKGALKGLYRHYTLVDLRA